MQSLREELRDTICRRIRDAGADELLTVVYALTADEANPRQLSDLRAYEAAERVRGALGSRFELQHDDQVVLDRRSGLMWSRAELTEKRLTWSEAEKAVDELELAGFTDWRLPTIDEMFALPDRTRHDPAIDTEAFPGCKPNWYWTSTPYAPSPGDCAWFVSFYDGSASWGTRGNDGFVRAVRAGQ